MADTDQVFKMILGIIASVFLLAVLLNYAGTQARIQRETQRMLILKGFDKAVRDVIQTGNELKFIDFSRLPMELTTTDGGLAYQGELHNLNVLPLRVPLLFLQGNEMLISRQEVDYGFWTMTYVTALPPVTVLLSFEGVQPEHFETGIQLVKAFPPSRPGKPGPRFGFCNGNLIQKTCSGGYCNREEFLQQLSLLKAASASVSAVNRPVAAQPCTAGLAEDRVATITNSCTQGATLCLIPGQEVGEAQLAGETFYIKDGADMLALLIGGARESVFGKEGPLQFANKNKRVGQELRVLASLLRERALLLVTLHRQPAAGQTARNPACAGLYQALLIPQNRFQEIATLLQMDEHYYKDRVKATALQQALAALAGGYRGLKEAGCV